MEDNKYIYKIPDNDMDYIVIDNKRHAPALSFILDRAGFDKLRTAIRLMDFDGRIQHKDKLYKVVHISVVGKDSPLLKTPYDWPGDVYVVLKEV